MKLYLLSLLFTCVLFLGCGGESAKKPNEKAKTGLVQKKKVSQGNKTKQNAKNKAKQKAKQKASQRAKRRSNLYWGKLKANLKLDENKLKKLKELHTKYEAKLANLPKVNGKPVQYKVKALSKNRAQEIVKLLGEKLAKQKNKFDKQFKRSKK